MCNTKITSAVDLAYAEGPIFEEMEKHCNHCGVDIPLDGVAWRSSLTRECNCTKCAGTAESLALAKELHQPEQVLGYKRLNRHSQTGGTLPPQCLSCGRETYVPRAYGAGIVAVSNSLFCSTTCKRKHDTLFTKLKRQESVEARPCNHCGTTFTPKRKDAKFCSTKCRVAVHRAKAATAR